MEVRLAGGFLPLLLLAWLPAGTASCPEESVITMECRYNVSSGSPMVSLNFCVSAQPQMEHNTTTVCLRGNHTHLTVRTAEGGICARRDDVRGKNATDTGSGTQWPIMFAGLNFPLCTAFGVAVGTLLYMPIICFLLWQRRKNRTEKLTSRQAVEGSQLSMAAPVTGTEDLTYADLRFENGTKSAASNVVYTKIKPAQQQQSSKDPHAGGDASPKAEGK